MTQDHAALSGSPERFTMRRLDLTTDVDLLHRWLTDPRSHFWQMQDATREEVRAMYETMAASPHEDAWIGEVDGVPTFFVETYDPHRHPLAEHLELRDDDLGMHLLVSPPGPTPEHGLTDAIMRTVIAFCFARGAGRVVVEPDVRNERIHVKNAAVGFVRVCDADLPEKRAALSVCTRDAFRRATSPESLRWQTAERLVLAKAIGEYAHELLVVPEELPDGTHAIRTPHGDWHFSARRYALDHWAVLPHSIHRRALDGTRSAGSPAELVLDLRDALGLDDDLLTTYLEELDATVAHRARTSARPTTNADLLEASPHVVESAMTEGHPCFVATNARIGFSARDLERYAPEAAVDVRPLWVAVPRETSHLAHSARLTENEAYEQALGEAWHSRLRGLMTERDLDPDAHHLLPVHPWQWDERIRTTFAEDVARGRIVLLGEDPDAHRPVQSIRTWINVDTPRRPYVKTALAIRNMGFVRGLSPAYMAVTPAINDHVAGIVRADATLRAAGFDVLTEFASIGYTGDVFHRHGLKGPMTKMVAALWREPVVPRLGKDEQAMTMAALLHRDASGRPFVADLVAASGRAADDWLRQYLDAYLVPIVHLLCEHRLAFIPHGENVILRLQDHVVTGVFLKDIGEEVGLMDDGHLGERLTNLPEEARRIHMPASPEDIALSLFTDVLDGFLRFLGPLFVEAGLLEEEAFWREVSDALGRYEATHPEAAASLPLRAPRFARSCLNRLQLRNPLEMVQLDDAVGSLIKAGELDNPLARHEG